MQATIAERPWLSADVQLRYQLGSCSRRSPGRKKVIYDLWGEALNMTGRVESHGHSHCFQITRSTDELIADWFECDALGLIDVRGGPHRSVAFVQ